VVIPFFLAGQDVKDTGLMPPDHRIAAGSRRFFGFQRVFGTSTAAL
jgi:hypothetical protein